MTINCEEVICGTIKRDHVSLVNACRKVFSRVFREVAQN